MPQHLPSFLAALALILVVPGPDFVLVTRNALARGKRAAFATMGGILAGLAFHTVLAASGLSALVAATPAALTVLKFAGAAYLVALGVANLVSTVRRRRSPPEAADETDRHMTTMPANGARTPFTQGALNNILNPKALIFFLSLLPQFIDPGHPVLPQTLLLSAIVIAMSTGWWLLYITTLNRTGQAMRRPRFRRALDRVAGLALIGLGVRLVTARL